MIFTAADSAYNVANSVDIAFIVTELFHFFENEHSDVAFLIGIAARAVRFDKNRSGRFRFEQELNVSFCLLRTKCLCLTSSLRKQLFSDIPIPAENIPLLLNDSFGIVPALS